MKIVYKVASPTQLLCPGSVPNSSSLSLDLPSYAQGDLEQFFNYNLNIRFYLLM